jgi:hypothetical protein
MLQLACVFAIVNIFEGISIVGGRNLARGKCGISVLEEERFQNLATHLHSEIVGLNKHCSRVVECHRITRAHVHFLRSIVPHNLLSSNVVLMNVTFSKKSDCQEGRPDWIMRSATSAGSPG